MRLQFLLLTSVLLSSTAFAADIAPAKQSLKTEPVSLMRTYGGLEVGGGLANYAGDNLAGVGGSKSGGSFSGGTLMGMEYGDILRFGIERAFNIHESRKRVGALGANDHVQDVLMSNRIVGRVSYPFGEYRPFAFGGLAMARAHIHRSPDYIGVGDVVKGIGYTAGLGIERPILLGLSARIAYHYEQYEFDRAWAGTRVIKPEHTAHTLRFALIQDFTAPKKTKAMAPKSDVAFWSGLQIGTHISGTIAQVDVKDTASKVGQNISAMDGSIGTFMGYNFAFNQFIVGSEFTLERNLGSTKKSAGVLPEMHYENLWSAAARVKAGYAMGKFMPYIAAGVAYSQFNLSMPQQSLTPVAGNWAGVEPGHGVQLAVGTDYAISHDRFIRAEYTSNIYAQRSVHLNDRPYSAQPTSHSVRLGIGWRL